MRWPKPWPANRATQSVQGASAARANSSPIHTRPLGLLFRFLVGTDQLGRVHDVLLNCLLEVRFLGILEPGQYRVECVQLEEVPMASDRRARPHVGRLISFIDPLRAAGGHSRLRRVLGQRGRRGGNVVGNPVRYDARRLGRVGGVWIFDDEREALRARWRARPREWW